MKTMYKRLKMNINTTIPKSLMPPPSLPGPPNFFTLPYPTRHSTELSSSRLMTAIHLLPDPFHLPVTPHLRRAPRSTLPLSLLRVAASARTERLRAPLSEVPLVPVRRFREGVLTFIITPPSRLSQPSRSSGARSSWAPSLSRSASGTLLICAQRMLSCLEASPHPTQVRGRSHGP